MFWWNFSSNIFAYWQQSKYFNFDVNFQNIYWKSTPSGRKVHINYWVHVFVAQEKSDYPCRQERIQWKHNFTKYLLLMIFVTLWTIVSKHSPKVCRVKLKKWLVILLFSLALQHCRGESFALEFLPTPFFLQRTNCSMS